MRPVPAVPMPLSVADWSGACAAGAEAPALLAEACRARYDALAAFSVSSGRAALWLALRALKRLRPDRTRVILPAYTCPTLGRAIQAAGLQGLCVEVSRQDFAIDPAAVGDQLDETVLAVVAPHMFGTAGDVHALSELCRRTGTVLIEDLAQACGARCHGRPVGTFGGVAFNSLGRSKSVRGYKGGVVWVNDPDLVEPVSSEYRMLPAAGGGEAVERLKQLAIILLSRPHSWAVVRHVPMLQVGAEDQEFDPLPSTLAPWQAALGMMSLERVDRYNLVRQQLALAVLDELRDAPGLQAQQPSPHCDSTYLRLALRVEGLPSRRDALLRWLQHRGIDARAFYTRVIYGYPWWTADPSQRECPAAVSVLESHLVLPLHYSMGTEDGRLMARTVREGLSHVP